MSKTIISDFTGAVCGHTILLRPFSFAIKLLFANLKINISIAFAVLRGVPKKYFSARRPTEFPIFLFVGTFFFFFFFFCLQPGISNKMSFCRDVSVAHLIILNYFLIMAHCACVCPSEPSLWERPCGNFDKDKDIEEMQDNNDTFQSNVYQISNETDLAAHVSSSYNWTTIYRIGKNEVGKRNRRILDWLPGVGDVASLAHKARSKNKTSQHHKINAFKTYYTHLQKFAVVFEQTLTDTPERHQHKITQISRNINQILCAIKITLEQLNVAVPDTVSREIMKIYERTIPDPVLRKRRNYETVRTYSEYIKTWNRMLKAPQWYR